jgi:hypothetical protein
VVPADPIGTVRDHDTALVPDDQAWGSGYATTTGYTPAELDEIAANMRPDTQLGYPAPRLFTATRGYHRIDTARCLVPSGHDAHGPGESPNRPHSAREEMDTAITTSAVDHRQVPDRLHTLFQARGWVTDQHHRPCHPWYEQLLTDQRIGLNTGIGYGYYWGEAAVVDVVLFDRHDHVLLTAQHSDPNPAITLALPGGYSRPADEARTVAQWLAGDRPTTTSGIYTTAQRRLDAETGVRVPHDAAWRIVRAARPVSWPHTTLHFWITTYTVAVRLPPGATPPARPGSGATWRRLDELDATLPHLWPDHQRALTRAAQDQS